MFILKNILKLYIFLIRTPANPRRDTIKVDPTRQNITKLLIQNHKLRQEVQNEKKKNESHKRSILSLRRKVNQFKRKSNGNLSTTMLDSSSTGLKVRINSKNLPPTKIFLEFYHLQNITCHQKFKIF